MFATINGLDLRNHPERVDTHGIMVFLEPRPHAITGSRFTLLSAGLEPFDKIKEMMCKGMQNQFAERTFEMHQFEREKLRRQSKGDEDFAAMVVIAKNGGPTPLPGGDDITEVRSVFSAIRTGQLVADALE